MPVAPVLAIEETLERMSGDSELLVNLFALYQTDAPKKLDTIEQLARAGDMQQLTRLAHSLAALSATVGASRMCQLAMDLEQSRRMGTERAWTKHFGRSRRPASIPWSRW